MAGTNGQTWPIHPGDIGVLGQHDWRGKPTDLALVYVSLPAIEGTNRHTLDGPAHRRLHHSERRVLQPADDLVARSVWRGADDTEGVRVS